MYTITIYIPISIPSATAPNGKKQSVKKIVKSFSIKADAEKQKKAEIKKYSLTRQKGFWGNSKTGTELSTNY